MTEKNINTGPHHFAMPAWISCAPYEKLLNMEIVHAREGEAELRMPFLAEYAQGAGLMHGGALVSLADTAVVMAIKSIVAPESHFATIELKSRFLAPVRQGMVTARARVTEPSNRLLQGEAALFDHDGRQVMSFNATFKIARDTRIAGITFGDSP